MSFWISDFLSHKMRWLHMYLFTVVINQAEIQMSTLFLY